MMPPTAAHHPSTKLSPPGTIAYSHSKTDASALAGIKRETIAMHIAGISYTAVAVAAVASFIFGGIWYGLLSKQWMAAANLDEKFVKGSGTGPSPVPFIIAFVALLVMSWMLAGVMLHLSRGGMPMTLRNGLI